MTSGTTLVASSRKTNDCCGHSFISLVTYIFESKFRRSPIRRVRGRANETRTFASAIHLLLLFFLSNKNQRKSLSKFLYRPSSSLIASWPSCCRRSTTNAKHDACACQISIKGHFSNAFSMSIFVHFDERSVTYKRQPFSSCSIWFCDGDEEERIYRYDDVIGERERSIYLQFYDEEKWNKKKWFK